MPFSLRGATKVNADGAAARDAQQAHEGEDDAPDCWICACPATRKNPLIFPCACRGTMSGVHGACVEQWIQTKRSQILAHELSPEFSPTAVPPR